MPSTSPTQVVVVDTNVLMHFERLDHRGWATPFPGPCRFVVPPTVISELDRHKRSTTQRLQRRARAILPWLIEHDGKPLRDGCELVLRATEPHRVLEQHPHLDRSHPDDRIVATAIELRTELPDAKVVVLSNDATLCLKARHHGLATVEPPEAIELPQTKTQEEQERDTAVHRLQELENRFPKLSLSIAAGTRQFSIGPKDEDDFEKRIQDALEQKSVELGPMCTEDYLDRYEDFLRASRDHVNLASLCFRLDLDVQNTGTSHADDVLVEIRWRSPPVFLDAIPDPPSPPPRPRQLLDFSRLQPTFPDISSFHRQDPTVPSGPHGQAGSTSVTYRIPRVVHGTTAQLEPLLLRFSSLDTAKGFSLEWTIHAAHQPEPASGQLHLQMSTDRGLDDLLRFLGIDVGEPEHDTPAD